MKSILQLAVATVVVASGGGIALGQDPVVVAPINNWSYQRHASTATEGFLRGQASVIQAAGQTNYLNSIALVNLQEAKRRAIANHGLYVKTYFENKELNQQYRERYAASPPTKEQWARVVAAALPDRLSAEQFDPTTGKLIWPHVLRGDEYKAFRSRIDDLMATRTPENSGDGSPHQRRLAELTNAMKLVLKSNIDSLSASQYGAAKMFLLSLEYEALLPASEARASEPIQNEIANQAASAARATESESPPSIQ